MYVTCGIWTELLLAVKSRKMFLYFRSVTFFLIQTKRKLSSALYCKYIFILSYFNKNSAHVLFQQDIPISTLTLYQKTKKLQKKCLLNHGGSTINVGHIVGVWATIQTDTNGKKVEIFSYTYVL